MMMVRKIGLYIITAVAGFMPAAPVLAADAGSCGEVPFPPALSNPNAISSLPPRDAETARHQAFEDVINWQKGLKTYRGCLTTLIDDDNRKIAGDQGSGDKNDLDDIPGLKTEISKINALYDSTVDTEKTIVGGYSAIVKAYCGRTDVDRSVCQQPPARLPR